MKKNQFKPSMFNVYRQISEDYYLVYNMLSLGSVRLSSELANNLQNNQIDFAKEYQEFLFKNKFIVPKDLDEPEYLMKLFDKANEIKADENIIICTTTACNMRCVYCYEEGIEQYTLTTEVIKQITDWLEMYIEKYEIKSIGILLFGGEPLIAMDACQQLMKSINQMAEDRGVKCYYSMGSNGVLFTRDRIMKLKKLGLLSAQITFDGPPEIHNRRRPMIGEKESFFSILNNIKEVVDLIKIIIKINFDKDNLNFIENILTIFEENQLKDHIEIKFEAIALTPASHGVDEHHCNLNAFEPQKSEMALAYLQLMNLAESKGFKVHRTTAHTTPCMFTSKFGFALDARGYIYKCVSAIGIDSFKVGHVTDDNYLPLYKKSLDFIKKCQKCLEEGCPYVPKCGGGCSYDSYCEDFDLFKMNCKKEFLETFYENYFVTLYKKKIQGEAND